MKKKIKQSKFVTAFVKVTAFPLALIYYKPKVMYQDQSAKIAKKTKPYILVSNHTSLFDFPLYLLVFFTNNIRFLMAEVLFSKNPFLTRLLYRLGGIYVDRDKAKFSFMGESLETLDNKKCIGIFPQGRLPVNGKPFPFKPSAVFIAMHSNAPILPVYTDGNYGFKKRTHMIIGKPITVDELLPADKNIEKKKAIELATQELEKRVYALGDEMKHRMDKSNAK